MFALEQLVGPAASLGSGAFWALALTWFRPVIARHGAVAVNFMKGAIALVVFGVIYVVTRQGFVAPAGIEQLDGAAWAKFSASAIFGLVLADTFNFLAVVRIGAPLSLLIHLLSPFVSGLLAFATRGEEISPQKWLGILLIVVGIALAIPRRRQPGSEQIHGLGLGLLFAFLGMTTNSLAIVWTKAASDHVAALPVSAMRLAMCLVVLGGLQLLRGRGASLVAPVRERSTRRPMLVAAVVGTVCAFYLYNLGIEKNQSAVAAALSGTSPLFAMLFAWILEGARPRRQGVIGALIAVAGATAIAMADLDSAPGTK